MAKVPKRQIQSAQEYIRIVVLEYQTSRYEAWSSAMQALRGSYNRVKQESIEYGFNNQPSHGAGTQAETNH